MPGVSECHSQTSFRTCAETAIWGEPVDCMAGQTCINGACEGPLGCNPGARECVSSNTYHVCSQYALWGEEQSCQAGWTCSSGQCIPPVPQPQCSTPGQTRCAPDGSNSQQVCNKDLQWEYQRTCDYGCANGYCRNCRPNSARCSDGTHYQTCNNDGTWGSDNYCGRSYVCRDGSCIPDPATACQSIGAIRCSSTNANMIQKCSPSYIWADYQVCQMGCFRNACRSCSTGERACRDSDTYYMCDENGQWGLATSCPTGYVCFMGSCQVPTGSQCQSIGQKRCSPSTPSMTQICGSNHVYVDYVKCGQGCRGWDCMECSPGSSYCTDSKSYKVCGAEGQFGPEAACAQGSACTNGTCAALPACSVGQRQCEGNNVQVCSDGQWTAYVTCPSGRECAESQGTAYCRDAPAPVPPAPGPQKQTGVFDGILGFFKSIFGMN